MVMKQCQRCGKWFNSTDSQVCDPCWEDMGQMSFFQDDDKESYDDSDGLDRHPIDTIFDREREMYGKDW